MPDDDALSPATEAELVSALAHGLRFDERGKAHPQAAELTVRRSTCTGIWLSSISGKTTGMRLSVDDAARTANVLRRIVGKRLMYRGVAHTASKKS